MTQATYASRILQLSNDGALADTRCLLLRAAGWHTETRTSQSYSPADLENFDLLLLCQTVAVQTVREAAHLLKMSDLPGPAMVRIAWASEATYDPRYRTLLAPVAPAELLEAVRIELLSARSSSSTSASNLYAPARASALTALLETCSGSGSIHLRSSAHLG